MIEVRIPFDLIAKLGSEVHANVRVIQKLRDKGVPVIGAISVQGVEHGKLTSFTDEGLDGNDLVYQWHGTVKTKPAPVAEEEEL